MAQTVPDRVNADFARPTALAVDEVAWIPSPQAGVDRKPLDRVGAEVARATSIVRYGAGISFPEHTHELGEEFLVLEGVFSDESDDFGPGTYVRNPPGSRHTPSSTGGCEIFVKLRQMREEGEHRVVVETASAELVVVADGYKRAVLHDANDGSEFVAIEELAPGASTGGRALGGGEEILLLDGDLSVGETAYEARAWIRQPAGAAYALSSAHGARFWVKRGHLKN